MLKKLKAELNGLTQGQVDNIAQSIMEDALAGIDEVRFSEDLELTYVRLGSQRELCGFLCWEGQMPPYFEERPYEFCINDFPKVLYRRNTICV